MSREKRDKATRQRHASTRLKKLEAELARLQGGGKVTTVMDFPMRFGEGRDAHTNRVTWLESEIADLRKKTGVKKSNLKIKGFPTTDYETGAVPGSLGQTFHKDSLGIAQQPSRLGSGGFGDKYTPTAWLKKELGPTKGPDPQKGTDQINTGSGKFATWRVENKQNQALQIAAAEKNKTTTPTTGASKLKISSDVFTIDPSTGEAVGVLTRNQRRAFEAREDVQKQLLAAQKNKTNLRIYKNKTAGG